MYLKKITVAVIIVLFMITGNANSVPGSHTSYKWVRLNGKWEIKDSKLVEIRTSTNKWGYYTLLDYNSVRTFSSFKNISEIHLTMKLSEPFTSATYTEAIIPFAIRSPFKSWFYHMYAVRFFGDKNEIKKIGFIFSDRIDRTKSLATKNNVFIKTLALKDHILKFEETYNISIKFKHNLAILFINNKEIIRATLLEKHIDGHIGLGNKNIKSSFGNVKIYNGRKIIFGDEFDKPGTLWVPGVKVKVTADKRNKK